MPRTENEKAIQPELPGFGKSQKIREAQRKAFDPPKEKREETENYEFPKGTPIYLGGYNAFCIALDSFRATKLKGVKISKLQAFRLEEELAMKMVAGRNRGKEGHLNTGKEFGAYNSGDYRPKKIK